MSRADYRQETAQALLEAEGELLAAHSDLMGSPATEVEGLDRAACSAHISSLARLALGASWEGVTAEQWRTWVREALGDDRAGPVLGAAEHCMRVNGLWPWPR
ncbi:MAG TPA: hypothetical protein VFL69_03405 [Marmoricola sp.]|nr:hypothetical protein [Marmoricola sp.]